MNLRQNIRRASKLISVIDNELVIARFNSRVTLRYLSVDDLLYDLHGLLSNDTPYYEIVYSRDKREMYIGDYFMDGTVYMTDIPERIKATLELYVSIFSYIIYLDDCNNILKWHTVLYEEVNNIVNTLLD